MGKQVPRMKPISRRSSGCVRHTSPGKYITLYQKQANNAWLMARDIWNSNHPAPGMW